jgi:predicted RNase H-like nuclease (RuvC/YqgF family)
MKRALTLSFSILLIFLTSCVAKKKYLEMQDGRLKAEEQVIKLTEENNYRASRIEALIADFQSMKNELMESNAIKDQYIDSLNNEIAGLKGTLDRQKESLQQTSFTFGFERQRMIEDMKAKDGMISSLNRQLQNLENENKELSSVVDDNNFQISLLNDKISVLEAEKESESGKSAELNQKLQVLQQEINSLQAQIREKDATITRLQNNVNLLKKELGN